MLIRSTLFNGLAVGGMAMAFPTREEPTTKEQIQWGKCHDKVLNSGSMPLACGTVTVPLDYTDPASHETLDIQLVKASHTKKPFKGTMFINYGGPGGAGSHEHAANALAINKISGGHYDLIGWDQRGTGKTLLFDCFKDNEAQARVYTQWMGLGGNASNVALGESWATAGLLSERCHRTNKDRGSLIGSVFTARDMMQFVDALNEDGLLRYWGFSYGTALGQTVASMFPHRMDKVILDGNLNPYEFWNHHDTQMYAAADETFHGFAQGCASHPKNCALSRYGSTAAQIEDAVYDFFERLKHEPMYHGDTLIDWSFARVTMFGGLYSPISWPLWARAFDGLMQGNGSAIDEFVTGRSDTGDRRYGIVCSDKKTRGLADASDASQEVMKYSRLAGDSAVGFINGCGQWKMAAKERYEGDFRPDTKNPVLIIGNTWDPITPLVSAHNMSTALPGSVVLEQHGYGHASLAQASECTRGVIQDYLMRNEMPQAGKVCEVDDEVFA